VIGLQFTENCLVYRTFLPWREEICVKTFSLVQADRNSYLHQQYFFVKSYINNWNENASEFVKSLLDDESFHVVAMTRVNKKLLVDSLLARLMGKDQEKNNVLEQIIGVEVDWVMSDDLKNHIHDKNRKWIHN
jgi:hypothetical protein